jgi:hypothetical protein
MGLDMRGCDLRLDQDQIAASYRGRHSIRFTDPYHGADQDSAVGSGAIETILPALGDLEGVDWAKPIGEWSKDAIVSFAYQIHRLTDTALAARDEGAGDKIVRKLSQPELERELSAGHGGPLLARRELNDDIPF